MSKASSVPPIINSSNSGTTPSTERVKSSSVTSPKSSKNSNTRSSGWRLVDLYHIPCLVFVVGIIFAGEVLQLEPAKRSYTLYGNVLGSQLYIVHPYDNNFVMFFIFAFTLMRWFASNFIFTPFSDFFKIKGSKVRKVQEAGWQFLYYASFVSFGLYAIHDEPYFFDARYFWIGYPHIQITYKLKIYYLLQNAFWFHMVFVWCVEAKRKDYLQMITHHFVTIFMVVFSYTYNWTHIGSAILLNLDCADLLLYFTKLINYIKYQTLSNIMFIVFTLVWIVTRHYLFIIIVLSVWNDGYKLPFKWDHSIGYYWTSTVYYVFMVGFLILQTLFILWFITIVKLIIRVLRTPDDVKDTRSDDSESEDDKPKQT